MKYVILAVIVLFVLLTPASALQIVFQNGKDVLLKGETAKFEFAIVNAYDNDKITVETKIDRVIVESDDALKVNPSIFYEGGTLLPKEGLIVQFNVKAKELGDYRLKVKVYYTKTMFSATEFGASIVTRDVVVRNVLLKVVDHPTIVLQNKTLVLNEVNNVKFRLIGLGKGKAMVEPLFDSRPSYFYFDSLNSEASFEFIPKKPEDLKFRIKVFGDSVESYVVSVKPNYVRSNGVSVFLQSPSKVVKHDCITVRLGILNLRKDDIQNAIVRFAGNETREVVVGKIASGEQKYVDFKISPKGKLKFYVIYFDKFGNAYPIVVEKEISILDSNLIEITNLSISNGKASGEIVNLGNGKLLDVVVNCGSKAFLGEIAPHSSKNFEVDLNNKTLEVTAKNEVGEVIKAEKTIKAKVSASVSEVWIFLLAILIVIVLLDLIIKKKFG